MTNNKQQTVVEQFAIVLYQKFKLEGNGKELNDLVEQAKEMEKEQIIDAWSNGFDEDDRATSNPLKYYEQTYGDDKQ